MNVGEAGRVLSDPLGPTLRAETRDPGETPEAALRREAAAEEAGAVRIEERPLGRAGAFVGRESLIRVQGERLGRHVWAARAPSGRAVVIDFYFPWSAREAYRSLSRAIAASARPL